MFLQWDHFLQLQQERHQDLRREFERRQLVQQVLASRERGDHFYGRARNWLGGRLVTWGEGLQARYGSAAEGHPLSVIQDHQA